MRGRRAALLGAAVVLAAGAVTLVVAGSSGDASGNVRQQVLRVPVGPGPDGAPVSLDATLFLPNQHTPAPAVVLAHGFGGSKTDETPDAMALARHGYVVLAYSARGFGASGGQISLDAPQFEVRDAQRLIDLLATRPEVLKDGPGDPRVGFAGASYGGALALLVAGYDSRVDAIAPAITWNSLQQSLLPQSAIPAVGQVVTGSTTAGGAGVFKRLWAGLFFSSGSLGPTPGPGQQPAAPTTCGRFASDVCAAYQQTAAAGRPTPQILALLQRSSPATILDRIKAPTLLLQGEADSLFPLSEASANARGIAANGTPLKMVWYGGGHDGGIPEAGRLRALTQGWFDHWLRRVPGSRADTRFEATLTSPALSRDSPAPLAIEAAPAPPAATDATAGAARAAGTGRLAVPLFGPEQTILAPAGGTPAAITSLPGFGSALSLLGSVGPRLDTLPGQSAAFASAPLPSAIRLIGTPTVEVQVRSTTGDATLFAKLYDVTPGTGGSGGGTSGAALGGAGGGAADAALGGADAALPEQLVAPLHLTGLAPAGRTVQVVLPTLVHSFPAGHLVVLVLSSTDQGYALPADARSYRLSLAGSSQVTLPTLATVTVGSSGSSSVALAAAIMAAVLLAALALILGRGRSRRAHLHPEPDLVDVPLALRGVGKLFGGRGRGGGGGVRAAEDVSFTVASGQVLGLLGPNGAGKTTVLRMLMGLLRPTEGNLFVFGHRITPGAPVLSRVGSFIEGPGFLPHLSGRENLNLFWRATGRPEHDAQLDTALAIAGLGADVERAVRTYSQGMRQRLALAQAMLGQPDLLVLDEPTNGLDPPQIREMRDVLRRYAATGRTVVISSHLLAEVELTCTHAVVMHHGRVVAAGPVSDLIGTLSVLAVDVDDADRAAQVARTVPGVEDVAADGNGLTVRIDPAARGDLIRTLVLAGLTVDRVAPARGLEQAFLTLVGQD